MKNARIYIGILCIAFGIWGDKLPEIIRIISEAVQTTTDYNLILGLQKPSESLIAEWGDVKSSIGNISDRELVAIFHEEMGKRLSTYDEVNSLSLENYYYEAAKQAYEGKLSTKYPDFGNKVQKIIIGTLGDNEAEVSKEEMTILGNKMRALAWILLN